MVAYYSQYLFFASKRMSFPAGEKMITAISTSHRVESSWAFLTRPLFLFANVICLFVLFSIFLSCSFTLPIPFLLPFVLKRLSFLFYQKYFTNKTLFYHAPQRVKRPSCCSGLVYPQHHKSVINAILIFFLSQLVRKSFLF